MKRELSGLGERTQEDQYKRGKIPLRSADGVTSLKDIGEIIAADDTAKDLHPRDHREPPGAGDGKRHARALATLGQVLPVTDEKKR